MGDKSSLYNNLTAVVAFIVVYCVADFNTNDNSNNNQDN